MSHILGKLGLNICGMYKNEVIPVGIFLSLGATQSDRAKVENPAALPSGRDDSLGFEPCHCNGQSGIFSFAVPANYRTNNKAKVYYSTNDQNCFLLFAIIHLATVWLPSSKARELRTQMKKAAAATTKEKIAFRRTITLFEDSIMIISLRLPLKQLVPSLSLCIIY